MNTEIERIVGRDASLRSMSRQGRAPLDAPLRTLETADIWRQALALPNFLTYLRFIAVPAFVWAFHAGRHELALELFAAAAVTDGLDGLLARVLHQRTRLGGILDPIADKLLTLAALATLVAHDLLPAWLLGLVVLRDVCIASAVMVLRMRGKPVPAAPTRLGKYSTFFLVVALSLALAREALHTVKLDGYIVAVTLLATQCVVATIVQYFIRWRRLMWAAL